MRIKNLRRVSEALFKKKTRLLHLGNAENHLIRNFLRNGRVRVKSVFERVGLKIYQKLQVPISVDQRVIYGNCICRRMRWIVGRKEMSGAGGQMFPDRPRHEKSMERISLETSFLQKPKMSLEWQFSLWYWICSKKPEIEEKSHLYKKSRLY